MGGPLLEDFSAVQSAFGCSEMISLEIDPHVIPRQEFNRPHCRVELRLQATGIFTDDYTAGERPLLAWFDHSKPHWRTQLQEACDLLRKLPDYSIFKISFASIPRFWNPAKKTDEVLPARLAKLKDEFGGFGPFDEGDVTEANFHKTLFRIFKLAVAQTIPDSPMRVCRPLASYCYNDSTQMLTITVIVGSAEKIDELKARAGLKSWPYANLKWDGPMDIDIPELSIRERLAVEQKLPDAPVIKIHSELGMRFESGLANSRAALGRYIKFARHVPYFAKVSP
jgi:hypothetical protein